MIMSLEFMRNLKLGVKSKKFMRNLDNLEIKLHSTVLWNGLKQKLIKIILYVQRIALTVLGEESADYCKGCEELREALAYERERSREYFRTLTGKPISEEIEST